MRILIIMRGIPGSGKTHYVSNIMLKSPLFNIHEKRVCSADNYFMNNGEYKFDPRLIGKAHEKCFAKAIDEMLVETPLVIIDNTNVHLWEISPYISIGKHFDYSIKIYRCKCDPKIAFERNTHGVPFHTIERMNNEMETLPPFFPSEFILEV